MLCYRHLTHIIGLLAVAIAWLLTGMTAYADAPVPIMSREYKLLLNPDHFDGADPTPHVKRFWQALNEQLGDSFDIKGKKKPEPLRTVFYYDTPGTCRLHAQGYVLRERSEEDTRELVLKFRSSHRDVAAHRNMESKNTEAKPTFEEDIGVGFTTVFSHTGEFALDDQPRPRNLQELARLFDGLKQQDLDGVERLELVAGLMLLEQRFKSKTVKFGAKEDRFTLSLWYVPSSPTEPYLAEISFRYKDEQGVYPPTTVEAARQVFEKMQGMHEWQATESQTKTARVYAHGGSTYCRP